MIVSIVARIRSRSKSSSAPFPCHPLLLSVSMASASGTRRQSGCELWLNSPDPDAFSLFPPTPRHYLQIMTKQISPLTALLALTALFLLAPRLSYAESTENCYDHP